MRAYQSFPSTFEILRDLAVETAADGRAALSIDRVMFALDCDRGTIKKLIADGVLPTVFITPSRSDMRRHPRILVSDLVAWLESISPKRLAVTAPGAQQVT